MNIKFSKGWDSPNVIDGYQTAHSDPDYKPMPSSPEFEAEVDAAMGLKVLTVRLSPDFYLALQECVAAENLALAALIRRILVEHVRGIGWE